MSVVLAYGARNNMFKIFADTRQGMRKNENTKGLINQAITHSMIKAEDSLNKEQYKDALKFYKYALRLAEMQFGTEDSIVKNLRLLLKGIDEFLAPVQKEPQLVAEAGWKRLSD